MYNLEVVTTKNADIFYMVSDKNNNKNYIIGEQIAKICEYCQPKALFQWADSESRVDLKQTDILSDNFKVNNPNLNKTQIISELFNGNKTIKLLDCLWFLKRNVESDKAVIIKESIYEQLDMKDIEAAEFEPDFIIDESGNECILKGTNAHYGELFKAATLIDKIIKLDVSERVKESMLNQIDSTFNSVDVRKLFQDALAA
jgi:hypothetical protein